jgi:hypothetical protein
VGRNVEEGGESYILWLIEMESFRAAVSQNGIPKMEVGFLICSKLSQTPLLLLQWIRAMTKTQCIELFYVRIGKPRL